LSDFHLKFILLIFEFANRESRIQKHSLLTKHNGMRPQDIVVLSKIFLLENSEWRISDLAHSLKISSSEIS